MKRFLVISILILIPATYAFACGGGLNTYNYYMFSVLDYEYHPVDTNTDIFWNNYSNGAVEEFDGEALMEIARKRGDKETQNYLRLLQDYLEASGSNDSPWDYPTKEELAQRNQQLKKILGAAKQYKGSRYKMQYALLKMRANRALKLHDDNIAFWEQTASHYAASALRNRMEGIYAGALLRTGKRNEACEIYAKLGDEESIKWVARHYCNMAGIKTFYAKNPNSPMLPYLVQRFVNNAQETLDTKRDFDGRADADWLEMLQVLPTEHSDVLDFLKFAEEAVANPAVKTPCLYLSAAGLLCYLHGDIQRADEYLDRADNAEGTSIMRDNLRCIRLLVSTRNYKQTGKKYEEALINELDWLYGKIKETDEKNNAIENNYYANNHYSDVLMRVVYNGLVPRYDALGDKNTALLLLNSVNNNEYMRAPGIFGNEYTLKLDSLTADKAVEFLKLRQRGGNTELQKWLMKRCNAEENYYNDVIGTKMLREERWSEAVKYLQKVPLPYLNEQGIAAYAKHRSYTMKRWMGKQHMPKNVNWENPGLTENVKIRFCNDMQQTLKDYKKAKGEDKYRLAYRLATMYYQASYLGDCWFLTQYGQSVADEQLSYVHDFIATAINYLEIAKATSDKDLRMEVLYARAFIPRDKWFVTGYEDQTYEAYYELQPMSRQFKALQDLSLAARQGAPSYVTRCDVLKLFNNETRNGTAGRRQPGNIKYFQPYYN